MDQNTNNQKRELSNISSSNSEWHSILWKNNSLVRDIKMTDSGPEIREEWFHKKLTSEELRASFMEKGCHDVIIIPTENRDVREVRYRYSEDRDPQYAEAY